MGKEIERKFLLDIDMWNKSEKPSPEYYRQGYLLADPNINIRIRLTDTKAFLTIKGVSTGATRLEYEYEIPKSEAIELLENFSVSELSKIRYKVNYKGKVWEVDEFLGLNEGLWIAEIELKSEDESFDIPEWVTEEVTSEEKYYNSNLTLNPYKNW